MCIAMEGLAVINFPVRFMIVKDNLAPPAAQRSASFARPDDQRITALNVKSEQLAAIEFCISVQHDLFLVKIGHLFMAVLRIRLSCGRDGKNRSMLWSSPGYPQYAKVKH